MKIQQYSLSFKNNGEGRGLNNFLALKKAGACKRGVGVGEAYPAKDFRWEKILKEEIRWLSYRIEDKHSGVKGAQDHQYTMYGLVCT